MKAAQASRFGPEGEVLSVSDEVARPELKPGHILVRVHACSLSPSDYRMLSGDTDLVKKPANGFPYIPGGDVCGVVEEVNEGETKFKVGDEVIGTWDTFGVGGLAEYCLVQTELAELKPANVSFIEGAALADSAVNAMLAIEDANVVAGERVLVLGGSGGFGTALLQLLRNAGVSYIAATSTDEPLLKSLGVDRVIDYRSENWWEILEFKEHPFDVMFDAAEGRTAWERVLKENVLKAKVGRFVAVVPQEWQITIHNPFALIAWITPVLWRNVKSAVLFPFMPRYKMLMPAPRGDSLPRLLKIVEEKKIKAIVDPACPFEFDTDGVKGAFKLMTSRHAHGKVVVSIRE